MNAREARTAASQNFASASTAEMIPINIAIEKAVKDAKFSVSIGFISDNAEKMLVSQGYSVKRSCFRNEDDTTISW